MGHTEIIVVAIAIVVLFGAKKIPEVLKGIGKGISHFKKEVNSIKESVKI
jgi:sec-independent protein translocase protein TatA